MLNAGLLIFFKLRQPIMKKRYDVEQGFLQKTVNINYFLFIKPENFGIKLLLFSGGYFSQGLLKVPLSDHSIIWRDGPFKCSFARIL